MNLGMVVPGGVDPSGEYRVIPALLSLMARLARRHELRVFALAQQEVAGRWPLLGAEVINAGRPLSIVRTSAAILREHRKRNFDLLHVFWAGAPALAGLAAAKFAGIPSLVHVAGGELAAIPAIGFGGQLRLRGRVLTRWVLANAGMITAASLPMINLVERLGASARRVPLGADLETWVVKEPRPRPPDVPLRLLHVASLNRVKDQPTLLKALARLRAMGRRVTLDIVGEDTLGGTLQRLAGQLGLADVVTFHGFRTQHELRPIVESAHLNVIVSLHEAGPLVVLEAAIAGVPTVGTAVGHIAEWQGVAALTVPAGDPLALAVRIAELIDDDPLRLRMAACAQAKAVNEDAEFTARNFEECYLQLLS